MTLPKVLLVLVSSMALTFILCIVVVSFNFFILISDCEESTSRDQHCKLIAVKAGL